MFFLIFSNNKYTMKTVIIIVLVIIIILLCIHKNNQDEIPFDIKESKLLGRGSRGLFATRDYKSGDIIENCPTVNIGESVEGENILDGYYFDSHESGEYLVAFGYCSLINHSKEKQNCSWEVSNDNKYVRMFAIKDIQEGEELFSNYGKGYWDDISIHEK